MDDLPSEEIDWSDWSRLFHGEQFVLLWETFQPPSYLAPHYSLWLKVPDWLVIELCSSSMSQQPRWLSLQAAHSECASLSAEALQPVYYLMFDPHVGQMRAFQRSGTLYDELLLNEPRIWFTELELRLGVNSSKYHTVSGPWLRWDDASGQWILMPEEQAEQKEQQIQRLEAKLQELGIDPDAVG